jgi:hypothetical protein
LENPFLKFEREGRCFFEKSRQVGISGAYEMDEFLAALSVRYVAILALRPIPSRPGRNLFPPLGRKSARPSIATTPS